MFIVTPIVGFCNCPMFCCALHCVHSGSAIILWEERAGCFALLVFQVSHDFCVALPRVTQVCLQFVNVVFANHTHLIFFSLRTTMPNPNGTALANSVEFRGIRLWMYIEDLL